MTLSHLNTECYHKKAKLSKKKKKTMNSRDAFSPQPYQIIIKSHLIRKETSIQRFIFSLK